MRQPLKIFTLVNLAKKSGREILSGILRYIREHPNWELELAPFNVQHPEETVSALAKTKASGFITSEMEIPDVARLLESSDVPLVVIGTRKRCIPSRRRKLIFIGYEEKCVGELGAKHLLSLGMFKGFGFIHYAEPNYAFLSHLRYDGFARELKANGKSTRSFKPGGRISIDNWLKALPKPAAVMAGCDRQAVQALDTCRRNGIEVPKQIALIGVDNDEYLCQSVKPSLTSIETSVGDIGYRAAAELGTLLDGKAHSGHPKHLTIPNVCKVIARESSRTIAPGLQLVRRAIQYINENASRSITPNEVCAHLKVSRRLADLRFREFHDHSISETILETRLARVRHLVASDSISFGAIAQACGFKNEFNLKTMFKRRFHMTMSECRKRHCQG